MKRVGIIRGGKETTAEEYGTSLKKGGEILSHIFENLGDKYKTLDILIDRDGAWHVNGMPVNPADLMNRVDVVWNTAHPSVATTLDNFSIPNVGNNSFSSALESSREMLREHIKQIGVEMPRHILIPVYQADFDGPKEKYAIKKAKEIHDKFGAPWIVKSFTTDTTMGMHVAKTFPELISAIFDGVNHGVSLLVEEFITGKIASLHTIPKFRGAEIYTFPLGNTYGVFSDQEKLQLSNLAKALHNHLGATHYLKSDFLTTPRGRVYLLQVESTPDFKPESHFSQVSLSVGANPHHIIEHILEQAF